MLIFFPDESFEKQINLNESEPLRTISDHLKPIWKTFWILLDASQLEINPSQSELFSIWANPRLSWFKQRLETFSGMIWKQIMEWLEIALTRSDWIPIQSLFQGYIHYLHQRCYIQNWKEDSKNSIVLIYKLILSQYSLPRLICENWAIMGRILTNVKKFNGK